MYIESKSLPVISRVTGARCCASGAAARGGATEIGGARDNLRAKVPRPAVTWARQQNHGGTEKTDLFGTDQLERLSESVISCLTRTFFKTLTRAERLQQELRRAWTSWAAGFSGDWNSGAWAIKVVSTHQINRKLP